MLSSLGPVILDGNRLNHTVQVVILQHLVCLEIQFEQVDENDREEDDELCEKERVVIVVQFPLPTLVQE